MDIEELKQQINSNKEDIINNMNRLHSHEEQIQKNSYALEILKDYKKESKRLFTALIIVLCMWFSTIGFLVYVLTK